MKAIYNKKICEWKIWKFAGIKYGNWIK